MAAAICDASEFFSSARVCVAVDQQTLQCIHQAKLRTKNIGIVLDHVDASTPLSSVSAELVEAVRFEDNFVRRASTESRTSCVLEAMLKLAHDLGLATLASGSPARSEFPFDYVLSAPSGA